MLRASTRRGFMWGQDLAALAGPLPAGLFIDGDFVRGDAQRPVHVGSPSDAELFTKVDTATPQHVDAAVEAATRAAAVWRGMTDRQRSSLLSALGQSIAADAAAFTRTEALTSGLCHQHAEISMLSCAETFQVFSELAHAPQGHVLPPFGDRRSVRSHTVREPCGVVGLITPFNYPLEMGVWKMAPALAAGNTVVWKAPELAPLTAQMLGQRLQACGFPKGVVNIVHGGADVGQHMVRHRGIDVIGFTGSVAAGQAIQVAAAQSNLKRCNLELGGNAALLVCDDYDVDAAADVAMNCFTHNGQSCTSVRRAYVPKAKRDAFLRALAERCRARRIGHALDPAVEQGPMITGLARDRVVDAVRAATRRGADLVFGGFPAVFQAGYFLPPTCVTNLRDDDPLVQDELFGPCLCVLTYDSLDDAVRRANATRYGLSANVLTKDATLAATLPSRLNFGTVWVNGADMMNATTPFGGTKMSGYGKDLGLSSLDGYSQVKTVTQVLDI